MIFNKKKLKIIAPFGDGGIVKTCLWMTQKARPSLIAQPSADLPDSNTWWGEPMLSGWPSEVKVLGAY